MKNVVSIVSVLFLSALSFSVSSSVITLSASEDTYITQHWALGGISSIHGNDDYLYEIGATNNGYISTPLVRFDLSAYSGMTVNGDANFQLYLEGGIPSNTTVVGAYESLSAWDENTSWGTMPGGAPYGSYGSVLDSRTINYSVDGNGYLDWTISGSVIQNWIDNATANYGLMLTTFTSTAHSDLNFTSSEGLYAPLLTFEASSVPEPSIFAPMGLGLVGLDLSYRKLEKVKLISKLNYEKPLH
jgi:hypothetical protein